LPNIIEVIKSRTSDERGMWHAWQMGKKFNIVVDLKKRDRLEDTAVGGV